VSTWRVTGASAVTLGVLLVIGGSAMPWLRTGQRRRSSYELFGIVDDRDLPGTLNVGHSIPTVLECVLFLIALGGSVDRLTLVSMVLAGGIGAWYGTGIVVHWPRRTIQRAMAIALLITAGFMVLRMLMSLSLDEGTTGFTGLALVIAVVASLVIGSLTSLGIGNYAPTMAFEVICEQGRLVADPAAFYGGNRLTVVKGGAPQPPVPAPQSDQFAREMDWMADVARGKAPLVSPGEEGLQDMRLMQAILESVAKGGAPVRTNWGYKRAYDPAAVVDVPKPI